MRHGKNVKFVKKGAIENFQLLPKFGRISKNISR